jgi:uncharacterized protein YbjT (DUF2867 family)
VYRAELEAVARSLGAQEVIVGDMQDEAAIRLAMQGVRAVYHVCPNMNPEEVVIGELAIGEARKAGVEHFVYHSVLHPQTEKMAHHWQKLRVEEMIFESGLPFTVLQPAPYMQNLLAGWESIIKDGSLPVPYSVHSKFSFVDLEDVAEATRIVFTEPSHLHVIYELAGTIPISHQDVASMFSFVLQRDVRAAKQERGDWRFRAEQAGMDGYAIENLLRMFEYYDRWGLVGNPNVLTWLLKREPTSLESFVRRMVNERNAQH